MSNVEEFDEAPAVNNDALAALLTNAQELIDVEEQISGLENLLKALNSRSNELKTKTIPDKMAEIGLNEFSTPAGHKLKVEDFISGSLPKDVEKRSAAIKKIEEWGGDGIISNDINISFMKSEHNEALSLAAELREKGFDCEVKSSVHPQTYLAFLRERLAGGELVDPDVMGIFIGRKTKVTLPKKKKAEKK